MIINPYVFGNSTTGYLDGLATLPRAVWSMRKLISTATKSMRVRRASDNTEMDIGFVGNALDSASLAAFAGASNAFVTKLYDQTTGGKDLANVNASQQPQIYNGSSVLTGLTFNGTSSCLAVTALGFSQPQVGAYLKLRQNTTTTQIVFESSANFNTANFTFAFYTESSAYRQGMNNSAANTQKINTQSSLSLASALGQLTLLYDRSLTGDAETKAYQGGTLSSVTNVAPYTNDQTGTFSTNTLFVGARNMNSLFATTILETFVIYDADTASLRGAIEALVA